MFEHAAGDGVLLAVWFQGKAGIHTLGSEHACRAGAHTSSLALNVKNLGNSLCKKKSAQEVIT